MHKITKFQALKFSITCLLLVWYYGYLVGEFGLAVATQSILLTWTFFILCTPSTNGGIIIDIPFHVITGKRMLYSEIGIWCCALIYNIFMYHFYPAIYFKNPITDLLHQVLSRPWPYWLIIGICFLGTVYTLLVSDDDRCSIQPLHRYISKLLTMLSLLITLILLYRPLVIIINTHGNP